jgi:hypothetical protein
MQAETDTRVFLEMFQERKVGVTVSLFEHVLEIAARLVRMNEQSEMEILRHGDSFSSLA